MAGAMDTVLRLRSRSHGGLGSLPVAMLNERRVLARH
jgi:hypothetical protein